MIDQRFSWFGLFTTLLTGVLVSANADESHFSNPSLGRLSWVVNNPASPWSGSYEYLRSSSLPQTVLLAVYDSSNGNMLGECLASNNQAGTWQKFAWHLSNQALLCNVSGSVLSKVRFSSSPFPRSFSVRILAGSGPACFRNMIVGEEKSFDCPPFFNDRSYQKMFLECGCPLTTTHVNPASSGIAAAQNHIVNASPTRYYLRSGFGSALAHSNFSVLHGLSGPTNDTFVFMDPALSSNRQSSSGTNAFIQPRVTAREESNINLQSCAGFICFNGGTCTVRLNGKPICSCRDGFVGDKCEVDICSQLPCMNGGVCRATGSKTSCECPSGYSGVLCEQSDVVSHINSSHETTCNPPCINGGTCTAVNGSGACICPLGFLGPLCNVFDSCNDPSACALYGPEARCDVRPENQHIVSSETIKASFDCMCPDDSHGWKICTSELFAHHAPVLPSSTISESVTAQHPPHTKPPTGSMNPLTEAFGGNISFHFPSSSAESKNKSSEKLERFTEDFSGFRWSPPTTVPSIVTATDATTEFPLETTSERGAAVELITQNVQENLQPSGASDSFLWPQVSVTTEDIQPVTATPFWIFPTLVPPYLTNWAASNLSIPGLFPTFGGNWTVPTPDTSWIEGKEISSASGGDLPEGLVRNINDGKTSQSSSSSQITTPLASLLPSSTGEHIPTGFVWEKPSMLTTPSYSRSPDGTVWSTVFTREPSMEHSERPPLNRSVVPEIHKLTSPDQNLKLAHGATSEFTLVTVVPESTSKSMETTAANSDEFLVPPVEATTLSAAEPTIEPTEWTQETVSLSAPTTTDSPVDVSSVGDIADMADHTHSDQSSNSAASWIIPVAVIAIVLLVLLISAVFVLRYVRRSRKLHGKYNPAKEENALSSGYALPMTTVTKEERLI
ncbi:hypothetical protein AB6A40_004432 [Gnathostoma spinigerum]|uniref:EGF-like domain-containing protein n=1 Tax=Gnathostoma spinigerum TaxID=75299 RepID=A0ABD6ECG9_9BILA